MCTGIRLIADNKSVVYGRTLEFAQNMYSNIIMIPRNYNFTGTTPSGKFEGLKWKSKYAIIGANAFDLIGLLDGINEKGLAGGLFYFPSYAQFQEVDSKNTSNSIAPWELLTWILSNFSSIEEIKEKLPKVFVSNAILDKMKSTPPIHAIIHEPTGKSLVIEYINGKLVMSENILGVFTNSPEFNWHITNLKNFINLSPININNKKLGNIELQPLGQGSGMIGLPGDYTSPSRFIRAALFSQTVIDKKDEFELCDTVFHILNLFDIPRGIIREKTSSEIYYEYTQWTSTCDLNNKRYYWKTYYNHNVKMVDLMQMDLNNNIPVNIPL